MKIYLATQLAPDPTQGATLTRVNQDQRLMAYFYVREVGHLRDYATRGMLNEDISGKQCARKGKAGERDPK